MQAYIDAVTRFIFIEDPPQKSDVIFLPGSTRPQHTHLAAQLYREGFAPYILPSGLHAKAQSRFDGDPRFPSEWACMHHLLREDGVPESAILREDKATFTWENALFSRDVLADAGFPVSSAILCCKAAHARRALFYYEAAMPDIHFCVVPYAEPGVSRHDWFTNEKGRRTVLGEVQRMGAQVADIFEAAMTASKEGGTHA